MIEARRLTKLYGARAAIRDLSFGIEPGTVVGFLGLNGAGKTTTLRILAGDLAPSSGTVEIGGVDLAANPTELKRRIGFLPDQPPLYPEMTVRGYLRFAGALRGLGRGQLASRVDETIEQVRIGEHADDPVGTLSHGYRQRLGIGQAIVHDPDLVILDEPIGGLDPVQIADMRELIRGLGSRHTVLLSSHILPEISQTCDRILVLGDGHVLADGTEEELRGRGTGGRVLELLVRGPDAEVRTALAAVEGVDEVVPLPPGGGEPGLLHLEVRASVDVREALARAVIEGGHGLVELSPSARELEAVFVALTRGGGAPASGAPAEPAPAPEASD